MTRSWLILAGGLIAVVLASVALVVMVPVSVLIATPAMACTIGPLGASPGATAGWAGDGQWAPEQVGNAATIVTVGAEMHVPRYGWEVAVATAMQESSLRNLGHLGADNDHDSIGLFQQRPSQGWGTPEQILDPRYASRKFYERLSDVDGWQTMPLTKAAQAVQRSSFPDAYARWQSEAEQLVAVISDGLGIVCISDGGDGMPPLDDKGLPEGFVLPADPQLRAVVSFALAQRGKPYVWGAEGPDSYDCSGLVMAAWAKGGVRIPRVTADQVHNGAAIPSLAAMRPGDLIFIPGSDGTMSRPSHVGMYIGVDRQGQQYLVQAPKTGDVVRVIAVSNWNQQVASIRRPR
ncbi:cell wall-associated NlpC family hydrolase [Micromonospora sp. HB375]|uniref:C40 family peptidase n=1 Tax=unclassified Micromonospora TaxID=2617518 RepID=UPI001AE259F8|nr:MULTISPECIES: C40 family peptidase [unclassified Micromonospora]MBP1782725.1 cell wall-associated NlpC family hydrolase [Micromonospora sp. HB375]MDH6472027.1 cell wall-associated NlpC family hydrolase [Micromonospora sp. H404/HB375]